MLTSETIEGFVGSCLIKRFDGATKIPECHREWWKLVTSKEKFVAIAAPRGHAKSTAISLSYVLASVLFRTKKFVLLVSDTETQANLFLGNIKQELQENEDIIQLFGIRRNEKGSVQFKKDTESDIIVEFDDGATFRIISKGAEQKLRGLNWSGTRPDLIVCDDIENDEMVMNKDRREKFGRWFYGALLPCRATNGEVRIVGTILHMDSMLERLMPKERDKHTIIDGLKTYSERRAMWKSVKYKAHNHDFTKILWADKHSETELRQLRREYSERGLADVYSQEYLNVPIDESSTYFKKSDFIGMVDKDYEKKLLYYVAADLAISESDKADYTAIVTGGVDEDGILYIVDVLRERLDGLEIVDTILSIQRARDPEIFGIEDTQISKAIGPFLTSEMINQNTFINLIGLKPHRTDKHSRARSIQARMRAGGVRFDKLADWYQDFEDELLRFPRDRHDDQVDAMAYLGLLIDRMSSAPTKEETEEQDYLEELHLYNEQDGGGRDQITGY